MFRMKPKTYIPEMLGNIKCLVGTDKIIQGK
jgi:hypothetical protein